MIPKLITAGSFDFSGPSVQIVPVSSRGTDYGYMQKHASEGVFNELLKSLKPKAKQSIIHVIAVGDEETYGPNRNGDAFNKADNVKNHTSFKDIGHVFKNHKNNDPEKACGEVVATGYNDIMSRIELLLGLDNDKCSSELSKLDSGGDIPVSMGSMQDYDECSICKHKAPTADKHCSHIKQMLGSVLGDGRKVYMKNPNPKYFDISLVFKPADRIAYTLKKVALGMEDHQPGGHELAESVGLMPWSSPKVATIKALASIYKEIPATAKKLTDTDSVRADTMCELKKKAAAYGLPQVLGYLHKQAWMLNAHDFASLIGHPDPQSMKVAMASRHASPTEMHGELPSLQVPSIQEDIHLSKAASYDLENATSMFPKQANARVIRNSIAPRPLQKVAADSDPVAVEGFAALYECYKVALAHQFNDHVGVLRSTASTF